MPTPSGFHGSARGRPVSHDIMQRDFLAYLRAKPTVNIPDGVLSHRQVEGEYPLVRNGQVISFVDAIEILEIGVLSQELRTISLFEIKPVIDTVYGIVRQAKSQLQLAETLIPADVHVLHLIVPHDDPLLLEMRAEWPHTWAWGFELPAWDSVDD